MSYVQLPIRIFSEANEIRVNYAVMEKSWPSPKSGYAHSGGPDLL